LPLTEKTNKEVTKKRKHHKIIFGRTNNTVDIKGNRRCNAVFFQHYAFLVEMMEVSGITKNEINKNRATK
jgi:hypothetical protein